MVFVPAWIQYQVAPVFRPWAAKWRCEAEASAASRPDRPSVGRVRRRGAALTSVGGVPEPAAAAART